MSVAMPRRRASRQMSRTGLTVPSTFETWVRQSSFTSPVICARSASRSSAPSGVISATLMAAPVRSATSCQGTMLAWCSIRVSRIASPGCSRGSAQEYATRLIAKVVPLVSTSSSPRTFTCAASFARAAS
jgi:hypothetical protein